MHRSASANALSRSLTDAILSLPSSWIRFKFCSAFGATPEEAVREVALAKSAWLKAARKERSPLERAAISVGEDGQIIVDKSRVFQFEKGQWEDPSSFLKA